VRRFPAAANRAVQGPDCPGTRELVKVIDSSLRHFFRHARENPLVFIEALFWRTKSENIAISRMYKEPLKRGERSAVEYMEDPTLAEGEDEYVFGQYTPDEPGKDAASDEEEEADLRGKHDEREKPSRRGPVLPIKARGSVAPRRANSKRQVDGVLLRRCVARLLNSGCPPSLLTRLGEFLDSVRTACNDGAAAALPADACFLPGSAEEGEWLRGPRPEAIRVLLVLGMLPPASRKRPVRNQYVVVWPRAHSAPEPTGDCPAGSPQSTCRWPPRRWLK